MKLSDKGKNRIYELIDCAFEAYPDDAKGVQVLAKTYLTKCDDFELEPDDFKGVVVLTTKEAAEILDFLSYLDMRGYRDSFLDGLTDCCKNLCDRIEKA